MNFLGHFFTSADDPRLMAGSFLGDFLKGPVEDHPPRFQDGLRLHRAIDATGDRSPEFRAICRLLRPACDRYAPVIADIVGDHLLARSWRRVASISLGGFVEACHGAILGSIGLFPPLPAGVATRMIREEWLVSYETLPGLERSLRRFGGRIGRNLDVMAILGTVEASGEAMTASYLEMMAELERDPRLATMRPPRPEWVILSVHGA